MGELFERVVSGERCSSGECCRVEVEHVHRYLFARETCRGCDVLDIASGDGHGAALLAQVANDVVGVDASRDAIAYADATHSRPNLRFLEGDARSISLPDNAFDVVVSFETIEHFYEHEKFLAEVKRVLRPGGRFILSSPERDVYSPLGGPVNPLHVRELTREELKMLMEANFSHTIVFGQRSVLGSALVPESTLSSTRPMLTFEPRGTAHFEASPGLARATHLVAVGSDAPVVDPFGSLYVETSNLNALSSHFGNLESQTTEFKERLMEERQNAQQALSNLAYLSAELAARQRDLERCRSQIKLRDEEHETLAAAYQRLWSENASLREEHDAAKARLAATLGSTSWHVTGPLRELVGSGSSLLTRAQRLMQSVVHVRPD